jgi:hypothetical protein
MNIVKNRQFFAILILFMSTQVLCSENTGTSSWFGGMYNRVKNYLDISGWSKRIGGIPLLYAMRSYTPAPQQNVVASMPLIRLAQYEIRKAEGATQEEFEKIKQDLTERLQQHQLTPPRATLLGSQLMARSAAEKREKKGSEEPEIKQKEEGDQAERPIASFSGSGVQEGESSEFQPVQVEEDVPSSSQQSEVKTKEQDQAERLIASAQSKIKDLNFHIPAKKLFDDINNISSRGLLLAYSLDKTKKNDLEQIFRNSLYVQLTDLLKSMHNASFCSKEFSEGTFENMAIAMFKGQTFDQMIELLYEKYNKEKERHSVYSDKYRCDFATLIPFLNNQRLIENILIVFQDNGDVDAELNYMNTLSFDEFKLIAESSITNWRARVESKDKSGRPSYGKKMRKKFKEAANQMQKALDAKIRESQK